MSETPETLLCVGGPLDGGSLRASTGSAIKVPFRNRGVIGFELYICVTFAKLLDCDGSYEERSLWLWEPMTCNNVRIPKTDAVRNACLAVLWPEEVVDA